MNGKKDMVVYVKLEEYKDIKDIVSLIRERIKQAKHLLTNIAELKKKEDSEIDTLSSELSSVEDRVEAIEKILTEPGM